MYSVLFVCTGNICRSPTAESVFKHRLREKDISKHFFVDSAGTQGYHVGGAPDYRSVKAARAKGVMMEGQQARQVEAEDFNEFNLILALDKGHYVELTRIKTPGSKAELALLLDYHKDHKGQDVPDPYYGDESDFEHTYNLIENGADSLLDCLIRDLKL